MHKFLGAAVGAFTAVYTTAALAQANNEAVANFYKGNTVYVVIGSAPGGGFDFFGRTVGKYMAKYIPGNPTVVPQNLPGAASLTAASRVAVTAPQDGTYIGTIQPGVIMEPIISDPSKGMKKLDFAFIGNAAPNLEACFLRTDAKAKSLDDLYTTEMVLGLTGTNAGATYGYAMLLKNLLGLKIKAVPGYISLTEVTLAMERGEVDAVCGLGYQSTIATKPEWFVNDTVRAITYQGSRPPVEKEMAGARSSASLAKTDEQRQIMTLYDRQGEFGRPFVAAANVPADRLKALRAAFMSALNDPDLRKELTTRGLDVDPMPGEEVQKLVAEVYATPPDVIKKMHQALGY
jgi:tripartite-type tricarboxylate transporter receptor subunit TctC